MSAYLRCRDEAQLRRITLPNKRFDTLIVTPGKLEMDAARFPVCRARGRSALLGGPTSVIAQIRFHTRHPPMARPPNTTCESSAGFGIYH